MKSLFIIITILTFFSVLVYSQDTKENNNQTINNNKEYASNLKPGYEGSVTAGYGFKLDKRYTNWDDQFNIDLINGYRVIPQFYIGAGLGVRIGYYYNNYLMPFYLQLKGNIVKNKISPYFSFDFGFTHQVGRYGVHFYNKPSVGIYFGRKVSFIVAVGSEFQKEMWDSDPDWCFFFNLNFGIAF